MKSSEQFPTTRPCNAFVSAPRNGPTFGCQVRTLGGKKSDFSTLSVIRFWQFREEDISERKTTKNLSLHGHFKQTWGADEGNSREGWARKS